MKHFSREKYDKYNKSISSKKSMQIVYYLCLIGIFSCLLLLFSVKTFVNREVNALKYKESSDVDYRVKLKPNEYYETDNLPSGMVISILFTAIVPGWPCPFPGNCFVRFSNLISILNPPKCIYILQYNSSQCKNCFLSEKD